MTVANLRVRIKNQSDAFEDLFMDVFDMTVANIRMQIKCQYL